MDIKNGLLESYSRGEITRGEIEDGTHQAIRFGTLLGQLHVHDLPLPPQKRDFGAEP